MGSVMGKIIRFPIEKCRLPHPTCEVCNKDYLIQETHRDFLIVTHSCADVPFDERLIWRGENTNEPVDDQSGSDDTST